MKSFLFYIIDIYLSILGPFFEKHETESTEIFLQLEVLEVRHYLLDFQIHLWIVIVDEGAHVCVSEKHFQDNCKCWLPFCITKVIVFYK